MFDLDNLKYEIKRAYWVLDPDSADCQNIRDIRDWSFYLSVEEISDLIRYNRFCYRMALRGAQK